MLGGLTSYWEPKWSTTLVYQGDGQALTTFLSALNAVKGMSLRLTFSSDLSKETGSALQAGSWWVIYSHTMPDTITVRINLAAQSLGGDQFELKYLRPNPDAECVGTGPASPGQPLLCTALEDQRNQCVRVAGRHGPRPAPSLPALPVRILDELGLLCVRARQVNCVKLGLQTLTLCAVKIPGLRSSYTKVGGLVSFGRLLDKIRLNAKGALPEGWFTGPQVGANRRCVGFLHVTYEALADRVLQGGTDEEVLAWCFQNGRQPCAEDIEMWNEFAVKRGWRDNSTEALETAKREAGLGHRGDIQTWFDFQDADEERTGHDNDA